MPSSVLTAGVSSPVALHSCKLLGAAVFVLVIVVLTCVFLLPATLGIFSPAYEPSVYW